MASTASHLVTTMIGNDPTSTVQSSKAYTTQASVTSVQLDHKQLATVYHDKLLVDMTT